MISDEVGRMHVCRNCKVICGASDKYCSQCGRRLLPAGDGGSGAAHKGLDLVEVYHRLGVVYCRQGRYQMAAAVFRKGLARDPGDVVLQERLAALAPLLTAAAGPPGSRN